MTRDLAWACAHRDRHRAQSRLTGNRVKQYKWCKEKVWQDTNLVLGISHHLETNELLDLLQVGGWSIRWSFVFVCVCVCEDRYYCDQLSRGRSHTELPNLSWPHLAKVTQMLAHKHSHVVTGIARDKKRGRPRQSRGGASRL
jgi:hypothetical protein